MRTSSNIPSPRIGVILSGCGFLDGAEIHESVLTLLALDKAGATAVCLAPDVEQHHVVNHLTGKEVSGERRNVLVESARIARGNIHNLKEIATLELDGLILPGGYGAAKNLSSFAFEGVQCSIYPEIEAAIRSFHKAGKPLGFICISPVLAAKVLGSEHIELTIGNDADTALALETMGARHNNCTVRQAYVHREKKIVSTPAYMMHASISEVAQGIEQLVQELLTLLRQ